MNDHFFDLLTGAWKTRLLIAADENETLPPRMRRALDRVYPQKVHAPNMVKQMKRMAEYWKELPNKAEVPRGTPNDHRIYMEAQEEKAQTSVDSFLEQVELHGSESLLDVGGGTAPYLRGIRKKFPTAQTAYIDIEDAAVLAKEKGLGGEIRTGDFREIDWGNNYHVVLISQVIHMYDDESVRKLFSKAAGALRKTGRLVIIEHFVDSDDDPFNFLFDVNMYLGTEGGRCRTRQEVKDLTSEFFFKKKKDYAIDKRTGVLEFQPITL